MKVGMDLAMISCQGTATKPLPPCTKSSESMRKVMVAVGLPRPCRKR
jgi:hypothetical protein